ncbi:hypothetical protein GSI_08406 [Ganoderma sinense ZZ0214-1]|uniref:Uncharacterized protein n=1 Tax=Ganoderma sinense ZZ0214-1 TaxID=1077348 RepID=A0A2G8S6U3_9APHY|nr:hypothetical protein GSI_08406 [Ganoderma sinense ZZ0214-1]
MNDATQTYPVVHFAAVQGVEFARTDDQHPDVEFRPGGVMLTELVPGEFAIIITAQPCTSSIAALTITHNYQVLSDTERLEVRWTSGASRFLHGSSWLHLRFANRLLFTDFNRAFWQILWDVQLKIRILQDRIENIAFSNPSNFISYCRQYLGDAYFDSFAGSDGDSADEDGLPLAEEGDTQGDNGTGTANGNEGAPVLSEETDAE